MYDNLRSHLNLTMKLANTKLKEGTVLRLVGDLQVNAVTDSSQNAIGELQWGAQTYDDDCTVRTRFRATHERVLAAGQTVVAGDYVRVVDSSGVDDELTQTWGKATGYNPLTDEIALTGGSGGDAIMTGEL